MADEKSGTSSYGYYGYGADPVGGAAGPGDSLIRYYLNIVRRRVWLVAAVFVVLVTLGAVRAFRAVPIFEAEAKLLVERRSPRLMKFEDVVQESPLWDPDFYRTQAEFVRSRAVLEEAIRDPAVRAMFRQVNSQPPAPSFVGEVRGTILSLLGAAPAPPPEPWERLRGLVHSRPASGTHFIMVGVRSADPHMAAKLANAVAQAFSRHHLQRRVDVHSDAFALLQEEKEKEEAAFQQAERTLQEFREGASNVPLGNDDQDQPALIRLRDLNKELTETQLRRIDLVAQHEIAKELVQDSTSATTSRFSRLFSIADITDDSAVKALRARYDQAEKERATLAETYGSEHPLLRAAGHELMLITQQLDRARSQVVLRLSDKLAALQRKEDELQRQYNAQKALTVDMAKEIFEFTRLQSEVDRHRKLYDMLVQHLREMDVTAGFVRTNVQVIEEATVPAAPVSPKRARMITIAAVFGLLIGVGLAIFFENLDDAVKTPEDLRSRLGLPLFGFVPMIQGRAQRRGNRFSFRGAVSLREPTSSVAEAYRSIRTSLFFSTPANEVKVVAVTSCSPGEGKTTTATNLAVTIARSGKRVLLIDADLHRPSVHRVFELDRSKGLTSILVGEADMDECVRQVDYDGLVVENLDILTAGPQTANPADLLGSQKMVQLISELRDGYRWIILDSPPVLSVSDASILAAIADGSILVVKSGINTQAILTRAREHLETVNARILGSILNRMVVARMGRYYSHYYYHGYSRYSRDYRRNYYGRPGRNEPRAG